MKRRQILRGVKFSRALKTVWPALIVGWMDVVVFFIWLVLVDWNYWKALPVAAITNYRSVCLTRVSCHIQQCPSCDPNETNKKKTFATVHSRSVQFTLSDLFVLTFIYSHHIVKYSRGTTLRHQTKQMKDFVTHSIFFHSIFIFYTFKHLNDEKFRRQQFL